MAAENRGDGGADANARNGDGNGDLHGHHAGPAQGPATPGGRRRASLPSGFRHLPGHFDRPAQEALVAELRQIITEAPLFTPVMPRTGKPFSVRMSNCGPLGWVSDLRGYRYQPLHPVTGRPWPAMPAVLTALWTELAPDAPPPEACLINFYAGDARMGLHQDRDEDTFDAPVVSVSLGDSALFRIGGQKRNDPTLSVRLASGDVALLGGAARLAFHGIDRLYPGTSTLLRDGGRINLTLRRVTRAA
ncbi:alpha-ketoglutarate-dependent dioxygenase AlkB family protein [Pannonibacter tanglangensis]|uniref:Alpha-ketoglutarate-dependent dioxygenase AlkB n=1 Tax=Pannonibacter tanglangensis TaxID=2750084 RepID=A0ABW9ZLC3_9HYPH|nr:alpha-ketoglutarate-dependent dioxygenase AlkB [Pannonibacter sp. XCT-34]NBN65727.1 alpha-ketoglutarate-dependent dioxygenase AlkB [Pannonibacter sp. XCT-34]